MLSRPALTRLLAVLLLLQWGTAFAHCLRLVAPAQALTIEICTADGIHRVSIPAEPEDHAPHQGAAVCPACQGPGAAALAAPAVVVAAPARLAQAADPPPAPPSAPRPAPTPYCQPRAPPTS